MRKNKIKIYVILLLITLMIIPFEKVNAATFDAGDCIKNFGKITFVSAGSDNAVGGKVDFKNKNTNLSWSTDTVTFDVEIQATTNQKIRTIGYTINSKAGYSCSGTITGSQVENNEGDVVVHVEINKGYVIDMAFWGHSVDRNGNGKSDTTRSNKISVKRDITDAELKEMEEAKPNIGSGDKLECTTINDIIGEYWSWVMILAPIATILLITIDFTKVIVSGKAAEEMKKASDRTFKRVVALVILMLLPVITNLLFGLFGIETCF